MLRRALEDCRALLDTLLADDQAQDAFARAVDALTETFTAGGKVLACGNGGSACDAMHFCEELTGRFRADRPPLAAVACIDPGHITCVANDYGFEEVFGRWVRALGRPGDCLILLSTSGNSENVVRAAAAGREGGLRTIALLGKDGGRLAGQCDIEWVVGGAAATADRIQEIHMLILHTLIEGVEARLGHTRA